LQVRGSNFEQNFLFTLENANIVILARLFLAWGKRFVDPSALCGPMVRTDMTGIAPFHPFPATLRLSAAAGINFRLRWNRLVAVSGQDREPCNPPLHRCEPPPAQMAFLI
jgi:hypothetical protein